MGGLIGLVFELVVLGSSAAAGKCIGMAFAFVCFEFCLYTYERLDFFLLQVSYI